MENFRSMKVTKLRSILKNKGASTTGNKETLVKRINDLSETPDNKVERDENNESGDGSDVAMTLSEPGAPIPLEKVKEEAPDAPKEQVEEIAVESNAENGNTTNRLKRKNSSTDQHPKKKIKGPPLPRQPALILNELQSGTQYNMLFEDVGVPWFVTEVEFKGEKYLGSGASKREAKHSAATNALTSAVQFRFPHRVLPFVTPQIDRSKLDFTSDNMDEWNMISFLAPSQDDHFTPKIRAKPTPSPAKLASSISANKNPVMLLNELLPGLSYECIAEGPPLFTMGVVVNGNSYEGLGKNKKLGRVGAAIKALRNEFGITMFAPEQETVPGNTEEGDTIQISGNLPDLIFNSVRDKFTELIGVSETDITKFKVLAGIVMTMGSDSEGQVIALATGTKCISGDCISNQGTALFDCHAEIVSRRGLRRFLYLQLLALARGENTVLEPCAEGGYRVKDEIKFHLYINTAPCGDARLFSPNDSSASANDNHPNRRSRGQLRTKIENGEGTIPVDSAALVQERGKGNVQQTWDAVISGERLLTMSCSDKIAKWNVLGAQGSLLSLYIQPVYLSTMILGSLYHCKHLQRGVFSRAKEAVESAIATYDGPGLASPYRVHRPVLAAVPNQRKREARKAPTYCVHWTEGDMGPKVINTSSGRDYEELPSNLCKAEMMKLLTEVMSNTGLRPVKALPNPEGMSYQKLKDLATDYQNAKYLLMTGFHKVECGAWVGKPDEVDQFFCPTEVADSDV